MDFSLFYFMILRKTHPYTKKQTSGSYFQRSSSQQYFCHNIFLRNTCLRHYSENNPFHIPFYFLCLRFGLETLWHRSFYKTRETAGATDLGGGGDERTFARSEC